MSGLTIRETDFWDGVQVNQARAAKDVVNTEESRHLYTIVLGGMIDIVELLKNMFVKFCNVL